eukprot:TRINITY_DN4417_c0_g1_i5.p1 TRINITY_DN4417_c0_g1~~TRINITY_DN4417_c0_g1_i5.p1  ORF type:complete len:285 (-),score=53.41 TRINITY_DN4417_c0_g1_i5:76-930(-)
MACSKNKNSETKADIADVVETQDITADIEMPAKTAAGTDEVDPRIIYVGGLKGASVDEIRNRFKQFGEILDVSCLLYAREIRRNRPLGCAFLTFKNKEAAAEALSLNGTMLCENLITVQRKLHKRHEMVDRGRKLSSKEKQCRWKVKNAKKAVSGTKDGKPMKRKWVRKVVKTEEAVKETKGGKPKTRKWVEKVVKTEDAVEGTKDGEAKREKNRRKRARQSKKWVRKRGPRVVVVTADGERKKRRPYKLVLRDEKRQDAVAGTEDGDAKVSEKKGRSADDEKV